MKKNWQPQQGQVGLIILLIMVVMVTVGVSVATRSVSELRLSRQEQESTRSLNLAESGIEEVLSDLSNYAAIGTNTINIDGIPVNYNVVKNDSISGTHIGRGHSFDVVLDDGVSSAQQIVVSWPEGGVFPNDCLAPPKIAAIVVVLIDASGSPDTIKRFAFDGCPAVDRPDGGNNFADVVTRDSTTGIFTTETIPTVGYKWARVKAIYADAVVSVNGVGLPTQMYDIEAEAPLPDGTSRAVNVTRSADSLPSVFDYVLFSGETIIKNLP